MKSEIMRSMRKQRKGGGGTGERKIKRQLYSQSHKKCLKLAATSKALCNKKNPCVIEYKSKRFHVNHLDNGHFMLNLEGSN